MEQRSIAVSVIIPCYNLGRFLPEAVDSVLEQSVGPSEIIVINDGSEDDTDDVMKRYWAQPEIIYIRQRRQGLARSRNRGLKSASGEYVQFLDADDYLDSRKFELQISALSQETDLGGVHSDFVCADESGQILTKKYASPELSEEGFLADLILRWERGFSIPCHCFLFRRHKLTDVSYDETLPNHEDWDFYIRLAARGFTSRLLPQVLATYRLRKGSMSRDRTQMEKGKAMVLEKARGISEAASELVRRREICERQQQE